MGYCESCFEKQLKIDSLLEENNRLKARLIYQERKEEEGFFGSGTPSAKIPVKANTPLKITKPKGARHGHNGFGREKITEAEADRILIIPPSVGNRCPDCGALLTDKGFEDRGVLDSHPMKAERILYRLSKRYCARCHKTFQSQAPSVMPKGLYGNQLISSALVMHYLHGIPMGRICDQIGILAGSLVKIFHTLARLFHSVPDKLISEYRHSPVKHADETGWRTNGKNGYAWLFATERISIFLFKPTRSSKVPQLVLGDKPLSGILVVDRYAGYNKAPCALQYCYAHLLRDVEDIEKEFPESIEVRTFVSIMMPLLTEAIKLRNQPISDQEFSSRSAEIKKKIIITVDAPAVHLGIRYIQDIFRKNAQRMYHWADDRSVPADNNLAERDLRPTVIARKVSFGSQSDVGADTRSVLMTVLYTSKKQGFDVACHLKNVLDQISKNMTLDPLPLLFPSIHSPP